jgi:hypothetical protein
MVAALYVHKNGPYFGLPDVDPWDEERDARNYPGPHPVVAHPPCSRWCRLAGLVEARWGYKRGDDNGCFEAALASVRRWGGVLEHPAYSDAWTHFGLPIPHSGGSWQQGIDGGWTCHIEQGRYGHKAKKATWLYAYGVSELPSLRWGQTPDSEITAMVSWCANHTKTFGHHRTSKYGQYGILRDRIVKKAAAATPEQFRDMLLAIARLCAGMRE